MEPLKNGYVVLRHGQSIPNVERIILSDPLEGEKERYTLTPKGEEEVRAKVQQDKTILLVSHGDPLQILETAFKDISPALHRSLPHLQTGDVRALDRSEGVV